MKSRDAWDISQLPGFEAIEEPEEIEEPKETKKTIFSINESEPYKVTHIVYNKLIGAEIYPDDNEEETMPLKDIRNIYKNSPIDKSRYRVMFDTDTKEIKLDDKKPKITTVTY